jgi:hypothetical protein
MCSLKGKNKVYYFRKDHFKCNNLGKLFFRKLKHLISKCKIKKNLYLINSNVSFDFLLTCGDFNKVVFFLFFGNDTITYLKLKFDNCKFK